MKLTADMLRLYAVTDRRWLGNMTLAEAATVFGNAENAARIEFHPADNGNPICILGFSQLDYIVNEGDCVRVALKQPVQYEEVHIND